MGTAYKVSTSGDWSSVAWLNKTTGEPNDGTPGAGDTAYIYADSSGPTIITTETQSVANVYGTEDGGLVELDGLGLDISNYLTGLEIVSGAYTVGGVAWDVTLLGGTLSGAAIGGTTSSQGGVIVNGGTVKKSDSFWGEVKAGVVNTAKLLSATLTGGKITATNAVAATDGDIDIYGGQLTITDDLTLVATSLMNETGFLMDGGKASVGGAASVGGYAILDVDGTGTLTLAKGVTFAQAAGATSAFGVSSPTTPGGAVTVTSGAVVLGGAGTLNAAIYAKGSFTANQSVVTMASVASGSSTVSVSGGKLVAENLIVGKAGTGLLKISGGGTVQAPVLVLGSSTGSHGTITDKGAGSTLTATEAYIGGAPGATTGGVGVLGLSSGGKAQFGSLSIKASGRVADGGTLVVTSGVNGSGELQIAKGGTAQISGVVSATTEVEFTGAGSLQLGNPRSFLATIDEVANGATIKIASFAGARESFSENAAGTLGTVFFSESVGGLTKYDSLHFAGDFTASDFVWNATAGVLTCKS
jgi:fibronectin-binding autotransporter adhesin